jgi:hypothetical protein
MTRADGLIALLAIGAAALPLTRQAPAPQAGPVAWPSSFEGRKLVPLAAAPEDQRLARDFPGAIARFSDGRRQVVLRSVARPTRQLHPARDCFEAIGYRIDPLPMRVVGAGAFASCFTATRAGRAVRVCERITDAHGRSFTDVSAWYWPALLGRSRGPWLAATTVEKVPVGSEVEAGR